MWKIVDRKLAEKRVAEIVETIEPKTGEEIETLLEHYIKSYSTLPPELRANFYHNSEEFVLQRVVNDLGNRLINFDYRQLLHKRPCRDVIEFALALDKTVKGVMRQRETVGDEQIRRLYQDHIDGLIRVRSKLYESCANHITRALLDVLRQDFEISRDTSTRIDRFSKCTRQVVDVFFKKLLAVDLFQAVSEIQEIVRRYILKHLDGENWTKVLARFQKESIKQQLMELADIFVGALNNKKEVEMYDDWKRRVDQALSK